MSSRDQKKDGRSPPQQDPPKKRSSSMCCMFLLLGLLGIIVAVIAFDYIPPAEEYRCDAKAEGGATGGNCFMELDQYFSENYAVARHRFREAVKQLGMEDMLHSYPVAVDSRTGMDYTIDTVFFPPLQKDENKKEKKNKNGGDSDDDGRLLVHVSGTHGVEGFVGSGIQLKLLNELATCAKKIKEGKSEKTSKNYCSSSRQRTGILFVHALNPFGFANLRRVNENNVDLNRNFFLTNQIREYVLQRHPNLGHYEDLSSFLNPWMERLPSWWDPTRFWWDAITKVFMKGMQPAQIKFALATAQYHFPPGLAYGGTAVEEKSLKILKENILAPLLFASGGDDDNKKKEEKVLRFRKVILLDVHSGLGDEGVDTILVNTESEGRLALRVFERSSQNQRVEWPGSAAPGGASSGYDLQRGDVTLGQLPDCFFCHPLQKEGNAQQDQKKPQLLVGSFTQEFGTVPPVEVLRSLILENHATQRSPPNSVLQQRAKERLKQAFFVNSRKFKESILRYGEEAVEAIVGFLEDA